jgi:hypothetical protein
MGCLFYTVLIQFCTANLYYMFLHLRNYVHRDIRYSSEWVLRSNHLCEGVLGTVKGGGVVSWCSHLDMYIVYVLNFLVVTRSTYHCNWLCTLLRARFLL